MYILRWYFVVPQNFSYNVGHQKKTKKTVLYCTVEERITFAEPQRLLVLAHNRSEAAGHRRRNGTEGVDSH